ncbi:nuclear protein localization protein 4 homolog isoform X3 [Symsagittifera roscoffensis]|uniref:nuclear protein localization protein 4 homolog isoform X3 n=1 Tax=Symsagittifera roscoffensis TaxID=84072 RepID=UPI00307BD20E
MTADKSDKSIYGHDVATIMAASCRSRKKLDGSREIKTSKRTKKPRGMVRIQKQDDGTTRRIEVQEQMSTGKFYKKVIHAFHLHNPKEYGVYRGRNKTILIKPSGGKTLATYKIKGGDMLFLFPVDEDLGDEWEEDQYEDETETDTTVGDIKSPQTPDSRGHVRFGKATEMRSQFSFPNGNPMKQPQRVIIEEEDLGVEAPDLTHDTVTDRNFMPFNDYLQFICLQDPNSPYPLEPIKFSSLIGCSRHEIYPNNKCNKCNPAEVRIEKQVYRHVDNIMFENQLIVERFVRTWRKTGFQRMGYMFGNYRQHETIPNGIRAVVSAIYEPPQRNTEQNIELLDDVKESQVQQLATQLGMHKIGWIFTDLMAERENVIKCTRDNGEGSKLSAEECIMAGELQNRKPRVCEKCKPGVFGSKFVTICVTGDTSNQIHFEGMMVSDQCSALVREGLISALPGSPELAWVSESTEEKPLPGLYFEAVGQDGVHRKYNARPLPVDHILVSVPAEFPLTQEYTFKVHGKKPFPIEHREEMHEVQDLDTLNKYLCQFTHEEFLVAISDFHLLVYLTSLDVTPLWSNMGSLIECIKNQDQEGASEWIRSSPQWQKLLELINGGRLETEYISAEELKEDKSTVEFAELAIQTSNMTIQSRTPNFEEQPHQSDT